MALTISRISYRSNRACPLRSRRRGGGRHSPKRGRSNQASYGINGRRDKRWPFYAERTERAAASSTAETLPTISQSIAELEYAEDGTPAPDNSAGALDPVADKALTLWLQWNDAYEKVSACMEQMGSEHNQQIEDMVAQVDQMRQRAVSLSAKLVA